MKLLNIQKEIPDILLDIRYCTTYNFIGEIIDGYIDPVALGTKELVEQLIQNIPKAIFSRMTLSSKNQHTLEVALSI